MNRAGQDRQVGLPIAVPVPGDGAEQSAVRRKRLHRPFPPTFSPSKEDGELRPKKMAEIDKAVACEDQVGEAIGVQVAGGEGFRRINANLRPAGLGELAPSLVEK